ncbi:MAG: hypothetical protein RL459_51 [Pseudomonadota bacterium]|jgi:hypothetical protein
MGPLDFLLHLLNFVAPAFGLAVLLPWAARWVFGAPAAALPWFKQVAILGAVGSLVLLTGLWLLGRDAKMLSYAALVVASATSQLLMSRSIRR